MCLIAVLGQHSDGTVESELDEARHTKAVFIARTTAHDQERR